MDVHVFKSGCNVITYECVWNPNCTNRSDARHGVYGCRRRTENICDSSRVTFVVVF